MGGGRAYGRRRRSDGARGGAAGSGRVPSFASADSTCDRWFARYLALELGDVAPGAEARGGGEEDDSAGDGSSRASSGVGRIHHRSGGGAASVVLGRCDAQA